VLTARLAGLRDVFPQTHHDEFEFSERQFPTYGMLLACNNPFAAAIGESRWCVFVAGTRSLGTSGGVLALVTMLNAMRDDPERNFSSVVITTAPDVRARVSALLYRTRDVERSMLAGSRPRPRSRITLEPEGLDPHYSDTYLPVSVEYLSYDGDIPQWRKL
jgi:hypothetical protein